MIELGFPLRQSDSQILTLSPLWCTAPNVIVSALSISSFLKRSICYFLISLSTRKRNSNVEYLFNASDSSKTYRLCVILSGIDRADSGGIMTEGMFAGTLLPSLYLFDLSLHTLHQPPFSTPHHDMPCPLAYSSLGSFTYDIKIMTLHISQCCENYMK